MIVESEKTTNYGLKKPYQEDYYDIDVHNSNMDKIDDALNDNATSAADARRQADTALGRAGFLENLTTEDKTSLVAAINEIVQRLAELVIGEGRIEIGSLRILWGSVEYNGKAEQTIETEVLTTVLSALCVVEGAPKARGSSGEPYTVDNVTVIHGNNKTLFSLNTTSLAQLAPSYSGNIIWLAMGVR